MAMMSRTEQVAMLRKLMNEQLKISMVGAEYLDSEYQVPFWRLQQLMIAGAGLQQYRALQLLGRRDRYSLEEDGKVGYITVGLRCKVSRDMYDYVRTNLFSLDLAVEGKLLTLGRKSLQTAQAVYVASNPRIRIDAVWDFAILDMRKRVPMEIPDSTREIWPDAAAKSSSGRPPLLRIPPGVRVYTCSQ